MRLVPPREDSSSRSPRIPEARAGSSTSRRAARAMSVGWVKDGGSWYYLSSSGAMVTGARWIDGTRYVFDQSGRLQE